MAIRSLLLAAALAGTATPALAQGARDPLAPAGRWTLPERAAARTPPMGWSSWNAFRTEVDEDKVIGAAKKLVDSGLAKLGYVYVNVDDGWWLKRRQRDGRLLIRTKIFPSADVPGGNTSFRPFTDRLHAMGLKAGLYTDIGRNACSQAYDLHSPNLPEGTTAEREIGLHGHVAGDVAMYFREWNFDYLKVDACGVNVYAPGAKVVTDNGYRPFVPLIDQASINRTDIAAVRGLYQQLADTIARARPAGDAVLSLCTWGSADVRTWGKEVGHLWRTSQDITPGWTRMLHNFDSASTRALYAKPGAWNDPDMLFVGHGDFDEKHLVEARTHFALWAFINAPLMIGYDLRSAPKSLLDIWGNAGLVGVNQDAGGHQAVIAYATDDVQVLVKTLTGGRKAVAIVNRGMAPAEVNLMAAHMKLDPAAPIRLTDLWTNRALAPFAGETAFKLAPRETRVFEVTGTRRLTNGMYLSELPGDVNVAEDGIEAPEPDPVVHRMTGQWTGTRDTGERPTYAGWGGAQADATPYDQTLSIAGQRYDTGLGILSQSRLEVRTGGRGRFETMVGIDDSTRNTRDRAQFLVYGDGKLLAQSRPARFGEAAQRLVADTRGVKVVELVVRTRTRTSGLPIVATWAEAALR